MLKTSQLTPLPTGLSQTDLIQVVDVSDTDTMQGGGGTNKRITVGQLATGLAASGVLEETIDPSDIGKYWRGDKSWQPFNKTVLGLGHVDNLSKSMMFTSPTFTVSAVLPANTTIGTVTASEILYLKDVGQNIQIQLDAKQDDIIGAATTITSDNLTFNRALISNSEGKVAVSTVSTTQLEFLNSVTGPIQDQFDSLKYVTLQLTSQTLELNTTHINKYIRCQHVTSTTVTVKNQLNVNWPDESIIYFRRDSAAGAITIESEVGVTINGQNNAPTLLQNQNFALKRVSQNVWDFI